MSARSPSGAEAAGFPLELLRAAGRLLQRLPRAAAPAAALAWAALVFGLSSISPPPARGVSAWRGLAGNLFHAFEFGVLALLCALVLPRRGGWPDLRPSRVVGIVLVCTLYGVSDELHQAMVPGRSPSGFDVLTDAVGAAGALVVAAYAGRPEARASGLRARLAWAFLASLAAALLATWDDLGS